MRTVEHPVASEGDAECGNGALEALNKADGDEIQLAVLVDLLYTCDRRFSTWLEREDQVQDIIQYQKLLEVTCSDMKRANGNIVEMVDAFYDKWSNTWSNRLASF